MHASEVSSLLRRGATGHVEIRPAWDGCGSFVLWAEVRNSGQMHAGVLGHEDGSPLRFIDPLRAHAMALRCGFSDSYIRMRWPPAAGATRGTRAQRA
ncbi:hypothetical protein [Sediminicurvatus halobius]|uniref:Uncharacterized protein n=1 Tax=Sediminicurvatus halobius TaxID=2182432 RepID=A0A2U2NA34_9GAMM|nr:hypothetical protein [Spiribacter halobius]PWG65874.1 hypothetical protein DEM34_01030 [Spiribacter halobius]UEX77924.1 hypothetical protein LMH63_18670 [Spiribacter halobius]